MNLKYGDEYDLIIGLNKGDRRAFEILVDKYYTVLYLYALNLTKEKSVAEDLLQDVFLNIWARKGLLNISTSLKSFLYKSIYHEFVNHHRKKKKEMNYLDTLSTTTLNAFFQEDTMQLESAIEKMKKEIETLPKKCKEVFILSKKEGLTNEEISQYLKISIKTVEGHISNAFKTLREHLKKT
ncbi:RNA polymerase sigma factor [Flagellimonas flava]|uniref:RNA polymerase sigma factor n=1 Tax=Flagellimonas flava TaxID=570519 RepID=UPI003D654038